MPEKKKPMIPLPCLPLLTFSSSTFTFICWKKGHEEYSYTHTFMKPPSFPYLAEAKPPQMAAFFFFF